VSDYHPPSALCLLPLFVNARLLSLFQELLNLSTTHSGNLRLSPHLPIVPDELPFSFKESDDSDSGGDGPGSEDDGGEGARGLEFGSLTRRGALEE